MATIAEIALGNDDLNILVAAATFIDGEIEEANLVATLSDPDADLTVFAPTDAAFGQLAADLGFEGDTSDEDAVTGFLAGLGAETLLDVVLYHVSAGAKDAATISGLSEITTLNGTITPALPRLIDNEPDLLDPSVTAADIGADNGIVHLIDRVLLPVDFEGNDAPTVTGLVTTLGGEFDGDPTDFDLLFNAVVAADLADALDNPDDDLTVFAPTDAAFVGLAQTLGYEGDDEAGAFGFAVEALTLLSGGDPLGLLTDILTYHVVPGSLQSSQVIAADGGAVTTLQGAGIGIDGLTLVDQASVLPDPSVVATDIVAANGIVHVIDGVLLPADLLVPGPSDDVDFRVLGDGDDTDRSGADNDFIDGNGGNDDISSGRGSDVLFGGSGEDTISGGKGQDLILGEEQNDVLNGGAGRDAIGGGHGADLINGGDQADNLLGDGGNDTIVGGKGNDVIDGGIRKDVLTGGQGADLFIFGEDSGKDIVRDFGRGADEMDLTAAEFDNFAAVRAATTNTDDGALIDLGDGNSVLLLGLERADLDRGDFLI